MRNSDPRDFKPDVVTAIWRSVDRLPFVLSATLAGSFATGTALEGFSDIDTILIVQSREAELFRNILDTFWEELNPVFNLHGWSLKINPTFGPLKFNDSRTAVLHLMVYDLDGHRNHVIKSPFTCLDWQRSTLWRKARIADIYPSFALQPRHFFGSRRSAQDYLKDLRNNVISYTELHFEGGCQELKRGKPMGTRDQHEFAYHILKFLMQNFLKFVLRTNSVLEGDALLSAYGSVFPSAMHEVKPLFLQLGAMKKAVSFETPVPNLLDRVTQFVSAFEEQFKNEFYKNAVHQVWFRHAPTVLNLGQGLDAVLIGRTDPPLLPFEKSAVQTLARHIQNLRINEFAASPLTRTCASARAVAESLPPPVKIETHPELLEINYGDCEGLTARQACSDHPALRDGWQSGSDPRFPNGENTSDVRERLKKFLGKNNRPLAVATHNVVLRELIGEAMQIPTARRHQIQIPHLAPIDVVISPTHGVFVNLMEATEFECFHQFFCAKTQNKLQ